MDNIEHKNKRPTTPRNYSEVNQSDYDKTQVAPTGKRYRRVSQTEVLKEYFEKHPNHWVEVTYLAELSHSLAVHSRIADLRLKHGMVIENESRAVDRDGEIVTLSCYCFRPVLSQPDIQSP